MPYPVSQLSLKQEQSYVCGKTGGGLRDVSGKVLIHSLTDVSLDSPGEESSPSDLMDLVVSFAVFSTLLVLSSCWDELACSSC